MERMATNETETSDSEVARVCVCRGVVVVVLVVVVNKSTAKLEQFNWNGRSKQESYWREVKKNVKSSYM